MADQHLKDFFLKWLFKRAWLIALVMIVFNIWFKPIFNIVILLFWAGAFYNDWLSEKEKFVQNLFYEKEFNPKRNGVFWFGFIIELMILMVGLHFLFKGFTTVTGVSEQWLDRDNDQGLTSIILSVSFIIALAIIIGMMLLLYKISNSSRNRQLVITYIIIDVLILMPFNFMFSYENNQKENLALFYTDQLQPLYDKMLPRLKSRWEGAWTYYQKSSIRNNNIDSAIREKQTELNDIRVRLNGELLLVTEENPRHEIIRGIRQDQRNIERTIVRLEKSKDTTVYKTATAHALANKDYVKLNSVQSIITGLHNGKIPKKNIYDSIMAGRNIFQELYNADTILKADTAVSNAMSRLMVVKESPTDGFFALLKDLFSWALKQGNYLPVVSTNRYNQLSAAQLEWNVGLPQKRWFCFMFSLVIDIFPLIIALSFIFFTKQKKNAV
jgi:hypothetical protein